MPSNNFIWLKDIRDNVSPLFFILGPCVIESERHTMMIAEALKKLSEKIHFNFVFKSSFDKANRTALNNFRGIGIDKGLQILEKVRNEFQVPTITDVHERSQIKTIARVVDVLQIPAFLCRQTDLLVAAGESGCVVHIKKGQFIAPEVMASVFEKIESTGNHHVWGCERGYTMGYGNLIVDFRNFTILKDLGKPVVFDATHAVQRPSGLGFSSDGDRKFVAPLAVAAISQGIAGVFMEVHDQPENALCDGPNSIPLHQVEELLKYLIDLDTWTKKRKIPQIL